MKRQYHLLTLLIFTTAISCKKYVDPKPPGTQLTSTAIFNSDATAQSALLTVYAQLEAEGLAYNLIAYTGMSSDELTNYSTNLNATELFTNNLTADNTYTGSIWTSLYKYIYQANAVMEGLDRSTGVSENMYKQLKGEALFLRSFCHFYLVNLFGEVPLVTTTDYRVNANKPRSAINLVYEQMITDLTLSIDLLSNDYAGTNGVTTERIRPNRAAAQALLSRIYLFTGYFTAASALATEVIGQIDKYVLESDLNSVFLKNSKEAIWQLQAVLPGFNSYPGGLLILTTTPSMVALSPWLVNSFEAGDHRRNYWLDSLTIVNDTYYYPFKYKVAQNAASITEYTMVMRLAELYLIRAEARAMLDNIQGALEDINSIRSRAGLPVLSNLNKDQTLTAITRERNNELFTEFGDRWLHLKRRSITTSHLQPIKGADWTSDVDERYPIPRTEIIRNPALTQNSGY